MLEIERKYINVDFDKLRTRLHELKASSFGIHLETNVIFDTPFHELESRMELLRLRSREWQDRTEYVLTFKQPVKTDDGRNKIRKELEVKVDNKDNLKEILAALGYRQVGSYEKMREEWELVINDDCGCKIKCSVDLDEVEFGRFCELEALPHVIDAASLKLGLNCYESSALTYHALYKKWCKEHNLQEKTDMLFSSGKLEKIRSYLGLPISG